MTGAFTQLCRLGLGLLCAGLAAAGPATPATLNGAAGEPSRQTNRQHWAFAPMRSSSLATDSGPGTTRNPIDRFWTESKSGVASTAATPAVLARRLSFDLTGLPPTPEWIESFERDPGEAAYERLVDQLLASRHFGERWARHWLDVARYADSNGYEDDDDRKFAWLYRDWVIRAFNADFPFDTFVRWQLAGDEIAPENPDAVVATGFIAASLCDRIPPTDTQENKLLYRYNELDDIVSTTGSALLGMTLGCARCHDHKFDPIPTRDYYRMVAAFTTGRRSEASLNKPAREFAAWKATQKRVYREAGMSRLGLNEDEKIRLRHSEFDSVFDAADLKRKYGEAVEPTDAQLRAWLKPIDQQIWSSLEAAAKTGATAPIALIYTDTQAEPMPEYLLGRGSVRNRNQAVTLGFLTALSRGKPAEDYLAAWRPEPPFTRPGTQTNAAAAEVSQAVDDSGFVRPRTTYQRRALAEWITDPEHGAGHLLARVIVNRLWQHHFGEGLVRTASDFGTQGSLPSNPALLDWLAAELIHQRWQLKPIHRLIVTSRTYRLAAGVQCIARHPIRNSADIQHGDQKEGGNDGHATPAPPGLLRRQPLRLEAEVLRDAMLAVSGRLNRKMFGPPFRVLIPKEAIATRSRSPYPTDVRETTETCRRSIYAFVKRSVRNPLMEVFDSPDPSSTCGVRNQTTVPTQALTLMNDEFVRQCALQLAQRVLTDAGVDASRQIDRAFRLALGRGPSGTELDRATSFLAQAADALGDGIPVEGLSDLCHALFSLNEFVYVD